MGFRNPATSAEAVDTGASPTGPGVRVYQDTAGPLSFPRGVVEFRDGIAGDGHATLTRTVNATDTGGGVLAAVGGTFALDGGTLNGVPAGALRLVVEEDPAGGFRTVAELAADRIRTAGPVTSGSTLPRSAILGAYAAGWSKYSTANPANTTWQDAALLRLPDAMVKLQGMFQYTAAAGAGMLIGTLPPEWRPTTLNRKDYVAAIVLGDVARFVSIQAGGGMFLRGALPAGAVFGSFDLSWPGPEYIY